MTPPALETLARAVLDGTDVDWESAEASSASPDVEVVRQLRLVASIGRVARTRTATWGPFTLREVLGQGTFATVYRAWDPRVDREVALKLLNDDSPDLGAGVIQEARHLAAAEHPNVVPVYGADVHDGRVGIWMKLIQGRTLKELLADQGPFSAEEAARIGRDLGQALTAMHRRGLVHGDVKAQNVMREVGGRIILMDFGAGRVADRASEGPRQGSPAYLAPEIVEGLPATPRSDIYSLSVLLYHLVTGEFPLTASSWDELRDLHKRQARRHLGDVRPDLPAWFVEAVERGLATRADDRPPSGSALLRPEPAPNRSAGGAWWAGPLLAATVLLAALGYVNWRHRLPDSGQDVRPGHVGTLSMPPTVAVLPFQDLSQDGSGTHLASGIADLLITDLGRRPRLSVLARTSSAQFVGSRRGLDLARELGVGYLVEGSLQREGLHTSAGRWNASVRVMTAGTGTVLDSRTFAVEYGDLGTLPKQMADMVASVLRLSPSTAQRGVVADPDALEAYFRGWNEYWRLSRPGFVEAERLFRLAATRAPTYAPAHAALAYVTLQLEKSYKAFPPGAGVEAALRSARTAVELDPLDSQALAALGWAQFYGQWDWRAGEESLRRAVDANPSDPQARWMYAQLLMAENRLDAALEEARLAQRLDPLSAARYSNVATVLYYQRRFEEALAASEQILARDPAAIVGHFGRARFLSALGRHEEATAMIRSGANANEPPVRAELARILTVAGREAEALALLPALDEDYRARRLAPDYYAFLKLARGEPDEALMLLRQAVRERSPSVIWIQVDPRFEALHDRPEFLDVLRLIGLVS